jgi:hypothetical protein
VRSMTWTEVVAHRLGRSCLVEPAPSLAAAASAVCGAQAQVALAGELALGARVDSCTRADVHAALWERRELVKTWTLRGTLHIHPAADLPLWVAATHAAEPWWHDERRLSVFGLSPGQAETIVAAITDALDGRALSTAELEAEVAARAGAWAIEPTEVIQFGKPALRWRQVLGAAVAAGRLCSGPPRGSASTFVRADQWLGGWRALDPQEALVEAFRRYLRAYGPARVEDFGHWLGPLPPGAVKRLPALLAEELEAIDVEGYSLWRLLGDDASPRLTETTRLVAHYDCYLIGAAPPGPSRDHVVPAVAGTRIFERGGGPNPALLVDGVVTGTWSRVTRGKRVEVHVAPFRPLAADRQRGLAREAERIGRFLGRETTLTA